MLLEKIPTEKLEQALLERIGDFDDYIIEPKAEKLLIKELQKVEGLSQYLQALLVKEIIKGFVAGSDMQRWHARGAHNIIFRLQQRLKIPTKKPSKAKMENKRYA